MYHILILHWGNVGSLTTNMLKDWNMTCFIWNVGVIAPSEVQNFLYYNRETSYKQTNIEYEISRIGKINNLISWNPIPPQFMHNFSSYGHSRRLGHIPLHYGSAFQIMGLLYFFFRHFRAIQRSKLELPQINRKLNSKKLRALNFQN